ncbi:MAG: hypothetical protein U0941_11460 [Planctomycetaceae bacterium]
MFSLVRSSLLQRRTVPASPRQPRCRLSLLVGIVSLGLTSALPRESTAATTGTWSTVATTSPEFYNGTMILLTDGSVMVQSNLNYQRWSKLTPDSNGSYVNGTWTSLAPMSRARRNFTSIILPTGNLLVLGGEFSGSNLSRNNTNTGEIYDPVKNTWKTIAPFPESTFGSGPAAPVPGYSFSQYVIAGSPTTANTYLYYPPSDVWFSAGTKLRSDISARETWLQMPNQNILSYDISASVTAGTGSAQETDGFSWYNAGTLATLTSPAPASRIGPGAVLPNGKVIQVGGNNQTALYTPSGFSGGGTWTSGPTLPTGLGADGAPGAMLPDGHFIFMADTTPSRSPTRMFDYNYADGTLTEITASLPVQLQSRMSFSAASSFRMLVIPNGGILVSVGQNGSGLYQYIPSVEPLEAWRPVIYDVVRTSPSQLTLDGFNITGISEGATYGCDARMSTNYPIAKLTQVGVTKYARTSGWTPGINDPTFFNFDSILIDLPSGITPGTYNVSIIANGIESLSAPVTIAPSQVAASFANGTLNINGDDQPNNFTMTYKQVKVSGVLKSATVTIAATDTFTKINGQSSVTIDVGTKRFNVDAHLGDGDDKVTFNSFFASTILLDLGAGSDTASFLFNSISTILSINGGTGTDTVTYSGNSITKTTTTNVP